MEDSKDLISRLSEIRSQYNCFNESEEPYYRALSEVIKMLSEQADGDTISRQTLKDALVETSLLEWEQLKKCFPMLEVVDEVPPAQQKQRWIPWNSGKFPEESGTYIVTAYDGATKRVTYAKYQKRLKRWELTGARAYWRVIAWMPLPEPYQKEGENDA